MSALDSGDPRQPLDPPASSSVSCVFRRVGVQVHMLNVELVAMLHDFHDIGEEKRQTDSADRLSRFSYQDGKGKRTEDIIDKIIYQARASA